MYTTYTSFSLIEHLSITFILSGQSIYRLPPRLASSMRHDFRHSFRFRTAHSLFFPRSLGDKTPYPSSYIPRVCLLAWVRPSINSA